MVLVEFFPIALLLIFTIVGIIKNIRTKNVRDALMCSLFLPFQVFFFISALLGGSALHNAESDYELYQAGHYYLVMHGHWTEVSYGEYILVLVSEIFGVLTFLFSFAWCCFRSFSSEKEKH